MNKKFLLILFTVCLNLSAHAEFVKFVNAKGHVIVNTDEIVAISYISETFLKVYHDDKGFFSPSETKYRIEDAASFIYMKGLAHPFVVDGNAESVLKSLK